MPDGEWSLLIKDTEWTTYVTTMFKGIYNIIHFIYLWRESQILETIYRIFQSSITKPQTNYRSLKLESWMHLSNTTIYLFTKSNIY